MNKEMRTKIAEIQSHLDDASGLLLALEGYESPDDNTLESENEVARKLLTEIVSAFYGRCADDSPRLARAVGAAEQLLKLKTKQQRTQAVQPKEKTDE